MYRVLVIKISARGILPLLAEVLTVVINWTTSKPLYKVWPIHQKGVKQPSQRSIGMGSTPGHENA
jgi:hypothetical protein